MTLLSDREIWDLLDSGRLVIDPVPEPDAISPSTVDVRLGSRFTRPYGGSRAVEISIDTRDTDLVMKAIKEYSEEVDVPDGGFFRIEPGDFVLGWTLEQFQLPDDVVARIEGRSTLARLGLSIHQTAPIVHATFRGELRLEISNAGPFTLKLYPGQYIGQLAFEHLSAPVESELESSHQDQSPS